MRLWSLEPVLLDRAALVAGWREALLAQKVLAGNTKGYTNHPQLRRFREHPAPMQAIGAFLQGLQNEATGRGYHFNADKIQHPALGQVSQIPVTEGQLSYELEHLRAKCEQRAEEWLQNLPADGADIPAHPLFEVVPGGVEDWEITH